MCAELRVASKRDITEILEIENKYFPCPWSAEQITACINTPFVRTWTARTDGKVAGYVTANLVSEEIHIINLAVRDEFRRQGIGTFLLKAAEYWGSRLGIAASRLEVRESSKPAIAFYLRNGYRQTDQLSCYYPDSEDGLEFQAILVPDETDVGIARSIASLCESIPRVGIVLGSGLSWLADSFGNGTEITYPEITGFSHARLPGHPGKLVFSECGNFVFLLGRRHYYQGYSGDQVSLLPGVLGDLGVLSWVLMSSSGAVDPALDCGDIIVFSDHVNFSGCIPESTKGRVGRYVYSEELRELALSIASETGASVDKGIFACVSGPAYETSSEIRFLRRNGISSVSMSTVPEALLLSSRGFDVVALSLITNAVLPGEKVTHDDVLASQTVIRRKQEEFLIAFLREIAARELR
ncbi:MAG: ribosomal protein S18-alanine N-acetyltransferase [Candidatus Aegiribacteria sp.]|nr:ribosomal protein S18-alanine N-acetyltransferase [Candidatus Aegiribacteria sp.]